MLLFLNLRDEPVARRSAMRAQGLNSLNLRSAESFGVSSASIVLMSCQLPLHLGVFGKKS